jgi:hypothetical protein
MLAIVIPSALHISGLEGSNGGIVTTSYCLSRRTAASFSTDTHCQSILSTSIVPSRQADMPSRTSQQIVQANKHHDKFFPIVWKHPREAKEGCTDQVLALKIKSPIRDTPNLISKILPWAPLAMYSDESMSWELGIREGSPAFSRHGNFQFPIDPGCTTRGPRGTGALSKPSARTHAHTHTHTHTRTHIHSHTQGPGGARPRDGRLRASGLAGIRVARLSNQKCRSHPIQVSIRPNWASRKSGSKGTFPSGAAGLSPVKNGGVFCPPLAESRPTLLDT